MWGYYVVRRKRVKNSRACCMLYFFTALLVVLLAYISYSPSAKQEIKPKGVSPSKRMALSAGAILGIVFGILLLVILIVAIMVCFVCILRREQQVDQRQRFYHTQHQQQYHPNSDPRFRQQPHRAGSYGHAPPQQSPSGPTVFIYQTDGYPEAQSDDGPRFYWHKEAEEVTEERDTNMPNGHTGEDSPTTNEPIVEFPDDNEEEEDS